MEPIVKRLCYRYRFRLITVFMLITVICLALGLWIVPSKRVDRAVESLQEVGATVLYAPQADGILPNEPRGPIWLRKLTANHLIDSPHEVFFKKDKAVRPPTDNDLRQLKLFRNLEWLEIQPGLNSHVTDDGIAHIATAKDLRIVRLRTQPLTDASLIHFGSLPQLEHLTLYKVAMNGEGFSAFQGHRSITSITLYGNVEFPHVAMRHLKHVPNLRSIQWNCNDDPEWIDLAMDDGDGFDQLTSLNLQGRITERAYDQLSQFPNLSWLSLTPSESPDENLPAVAQIPKLKELLLYSPKITDRGIEALRNATGLEQLTVYFAEHLSNASLESLVNLPHLAHIDIRDAPFDDAALQTLARMTSLESVHIRGSLISKAAVTEFTNDHPGLRVEIDSLD